jgi:DNA-binding beta-propeller fold protein YncE
MRLTNVEGRIDHLGIDLARERLFVCALANGTVEILDLHKDRREHSIIGLGAPQGIAYLPWLDRLVIANKHGGVVKFYDGKSFQFLSQLSLGDDADNVRYDEVAKRVYVGFGDGGIAMIDPATGKQIGSIKLSAHPEAFELERQGTRMFVNLPNSRQVGLIDRKEGKLIKTWRTDAATGNFPMALDEPNHRLLIGCRLPPKMVVLNTDSGEVVARTDLSGDPDDIFHDGERHRFYVICGSGEIDVIEQADPNSYKISAKIETAPGARTGLFVPDRQTLFVAVPHRGTQEAEIRIYQVE